MLSRVLMKKEILKTFALMNINSLLLLDGALEATC